MFLRTIIALVLVLSHLAGTAKAEDRRTDKTNLSIMTFNAEFLWDGRHPEEGQADFSWKGSPDEADEHMEAIADVIKASDPDMAVLVEVENLEALNHLNDQFLNGRGYKAFLVDGKDSFTGQDVGLLTRIDPVEINRDDNEATSGNITKGVSKNFYAKFNIGDEKIALIGTHFLARPLSSNRKHKREAQAKVILQRALTLKQEGYQPIVLGDLNDYDGSPEAIDVLENRPISQVVSLLRRMDPSTTDDDLISAAQFVGQAERFTSWWDKNDNERVEPGQEFTSIDHILLPASLESRITSVTFANDFDPRNVSDHFPIVVALSMPTNTGGGSGTGDGEQQVNIRIHSALPNPAGDEKQNESVTLVNLGTGIVNLDGWKLRDRAGKTWNIGVGHINSSGRLTIVRNGQPMALNNTGDTIDLINQNEKLMDSASYGRATEGEIIAFQPTNDTTPLVVINLPPEDEEPPFQPSGNGTRIRFMAANITSGRNQSYDPGHGIRMFKGLKPDIVLIQEFNYKSNSEAEIKEFVMSTFGSSFDYCREKDAQIPNGVISRWKIIDDGVWEDSAAPNREFAWAKIDIPGDKDLWVVSVHFLTRSGGVRNNQAKELLRYINQHIPSQDYLIIGGDLNTKSASEAALATLDSITSLAHKPADSQGRRGTNASRSKPYDWLLPDDDLAPHHVAVEIGNQKYESGLVFDSRVFRPLSLVSPVLQTDSSAQNMQHMPVVKDYVIPVP